MGQQTGGKPTRQSARAAARKAALEVTRTQRARREERERRIQDQVVRFLTAIAERDAAVAEAEAAAGIALRDLCEREGLTLREAVEWTGDAVGLREAQRLRALATTDAAEPGDGDERDQAGDGAEAGAAGEAVSVPAGAARGGGAGASATA